MVYFQLLKMHVCWLLNWLHKSILPVVFTTYWNWVQIIKSKDIRSNLFKNMCVYRVYSLSLPIPHSNQIILVSEYKEK